MNDDRFMHYDGAYVLGALDAGERAEFETHLRTCVACRARVDEVAPMAALLAGVPESLVQTDGPHAEPIPDTLLPGLLRRADRERRRRRLVTGSIAAVAAACLVALAVALWPAATNTPAAPRQQALTAVVPSPVTATAALVSKKWGTEIDVRCRYSYEVEGGRPYGLRVIDTDGKAHDAGSWKLVPGAQIKFKGGTEVPRDRISKVQITRSDGTPILQLKL